MKKFTFLWCFLLGFTTLLNAQHLTTLEELELIEESREQVNLQNQNTLENDVLLAKLADAGYQINSVEELSRLQTDIKSQNRDVMADIIPTAGETETFNVVDGDMFYDPSDGVNGGPGGVCTGTSSGDPGDYPNCGCTTVTTLSASDLSVTFLSFNIFGNFDILNIYDGPDTSSPQIYDSNTNGTTDTYAGMVDLVGNPPVFTSTSGSLTFEFTATAVVNSCGWEAEISTSGGGGGSCTSSSITTAFTAGNQFAGNMFDITASGDEDVEIEKFDINIDAATANISVYSRPGSYVGFENDPAGWTLMGTEEVVGQGENNPTELNVGGLVIPQGETYGIYITVTDYPSVSMYYTNGDNVHDDGVVTVETGVGKGDPDFTGSTFPSRSWNGTVYYCSEDTGGGGGPFPSPYCGPLTFDFDVEPITLVEVADISNVSDAAINGSPAHEDFTSIIGNMEAEESYSIALEGNTGGNWENRFVVFIDWNQNEILDDSGEVYEMDNTITNSTGTDGQQALGTISVPADALGGETRMRVKKIFGTTSFLDPCVGGGFGQVEDYTLNITLPDPCLVEMFPFTETFEDDSSSRDCWTQTQEVGSANWTYATGSSGGVINTANTGSLNARFVSSSGTNTPITKLISPPMDLTALGEAEVNFFYGQEVWLGDQNQLKVYYRISATDPWVEIAHYTSNVASWTEETLILPEVSESLQIAFEGINNWGRANVVDDVTVRAAPPGNDLIVNAYDADEFAQPYTDVGARIQFATNETLNPQGCAIAGTNGVWYKFTAEVDGTAEGSVVDPSGATAVIFYEAPDEDVADETELTFSPEATNQCGPGNDNSITTVAGQSYYVFVLNTGGPSDVVIDLTNTILSAGDNTIDGFTFYPNPAMNVINVSANTMLDNVSMYNMLGQKVLDQNISATTSQLDVSNLASGTYLMKVSAEGQTGTYQIIKR